MIRLPLTAGIAAAVAFGTAVKAAVIITALPVPLIIHTDFFLTYEQLDVDGNGAVDFTFGYDFSAVGLRTESANRAAILPSSPPNIGGRPFQIPIAYVIGSTLEPSGNTNLLWSSSDFVDGFVSPGENRFMGIVQVLSTGSSSSFNGRGAIGIEFEAADGIHYGYIDIDSGPGYAGLTLYGWAYESQPGVAIPAGQVPEPSHIMLLVTGSVVLLTKRQRNQKQNKSRMGNRS